MKKRVFYAVVLLINVLLITNCYVKTSKTEKLKNQHAKFLKNHPFNKTVSLSKKERKKQGLPPNAYYEQEYLNEINPATGRTHPENYIQLQQELKNQRLSQRVPGDAANNAWEERGPNNVGGRTRTLLLDPNDANHKRVFAGGVSGGLWVNNDITDVNSSWSRVGIDENLSISCITVDPNNSQIMYVGTGESYTGDQAIGNGVWKSTDGGTTWTNVFNDNNNPNITDRLFYINTIKAWNNPSTNQTEVFIGVGGAYYTEGAQWAGDGKTGLFKSTDGGANWVKQNLPSIPGSATEYEPNDIEVGIDNTLWIATEGNVYGKGGGTVIKSSDGTNFTTAYINPTAYASRSQIALSKQDANTMYMVIAIKHYSGGQLQAPFLKFVKTTNGFSTTTDVNLPADVDTDLSPLDFTRGQAGYDLLLEVDPTDDTILYTGGINLFRSTNSGSSWSQISKWSNNNDMAGLTVPLVHSDQHILIFDPTNSDKAVIGNDGGVFYASSLTNASSVTTSISARNKDYNVMQFYNGAIGQDANSDQLLAGAQDNGTQFIDGASPGINSSVQAFGGDGAYSFIDKDGVYAISSYVYNVKGISTLPFDGTYSYIDNDQSSGSFINPQELDDNLDILYANSYNNSGSTRFARYTSLTAVNPVRTNFTIGSSNSHCTALKISPFTTGSSTLFLGTATGKLYKISNADTNPSSTDISSFSFVGSISSIEFGANENEILVTFHNYGVTSIWFTEDGGTTWMNKEGNFPDIPVKAILMNPLNNDQVIIGTQLGVWYTYNFKDANPNWQQAYNGMSNVKVTSFELRTSDNTILATTYGRGMFTGKFTAATAATTTIDFHSSFDVYPTISDGHFTVSTNLDLGKTNLTIFDIQGKQVFTQKVDFNHQKKQEISVTLTSGVYIVHLIDEQQQKSTRKIIIK